MRAFIVFALIAIVSADVGGYNYAANSGSVSGGGSSHEGSHGGFHGGAHEVSHSGPAVTEYSKEFYSYSAPEGDFDQGHNLNDLANSLKKNLRVIFIRAPENNGVSNAALQLAQAAGDSRTAIYVLTKEADLSNLANQLRQVNNQNANKPEVHFVRYRTPEDAAHAQHTIQQEYERLGGSSVSHNGGTPAVLNFASRAPAAAPSNSYIPPAAPAPPSAPAAAPSTGYLPVAKL